MAQAEIIEERITDSELDELFTGSDRMGTMAFVSLIVHATVLLGVGFVSLAPNFDLPPLIEVTISTEPTDERPEDFDFIAPDNQEGGGSLEEARRPELAGSVAPDPRDQASLVRELESVRERLRNNEIEQILLASRAQEVETRAEDIDPSARRPEREPVAQAETHEQAAMDLTDLSREIDWDARYPSKERINARTRSHVAAAYMDDWIRRVERIGNLNYPDEARRQGLSGQLILEVTLLPDGSVDSVKVLRRSEHALLDESAIRVVMLAQPFAPVPVDVLAGKNRLVITRTWEFIRDGGLETR